MANQYTIKRFISKTKAECNYCKKIKYLKEFYTHNSCRSGRNSWCIECTNIRSKRWYNINKARSLANTREAKLLREYGISVEKYQELLKQQGGLCKICKQLETQQRKLSIDHNHKTGKVRGLLCNRCNVAIGLLNEDIGIIHNVIIYLGE